MLYHERTDWIENTNVP